MIISPNKCNYYINSNEVGCLMTSPAMYPFFHYRGRDGVVCFADIWCLQATRKEVYHYGGGGLGPRHFNLKKHDFALWVGVMAWTCTHNLRVVLGPCAHCWPRSNKWSKSKKKHNWMLSTIRFVSTSWPFFCGRMSKSDKRSPCYANSKLGQKWRPGIFWTKNWPF